MAWTVYQVVYSLKSPLHIGWRKISNLMQTRYYVSGRVWWGVATAYLTQWLGSRDYQDIGKFVRDSLIFGYFYPTINPDKPLLPRYNKKDGEWYYGDYTSVQFEQKFLRSLVSTAIDSQANSAEEGLLHEVEYIVPWLSLNEPVYLVGHVFAKAGEEIHPEQNDIVVKGMSLFREVLAAVRIGGERRYGFGEVQVNREQINQVEHIFRLTFDGTGQQPLVKIKENYPVFSHTLIDEVEAIGAVEPLIGSAWDQIRGPGRQLHHLGICYVPGSIITSDMIFAVGDFGIWKRVETNDD